MPKLTAAGTTSITPVFAFKLSGSLSTAALVAAMLTVSQVIAALPARRVVHRFGERAGMLLSGGLIAIGAATCAVAPSAAGYAPRCISTAPKSMKQKG